MEANPGVVLSSCQRDLIDAHGQKVTSARGLAGLEGVVVGIGHHAHGQRIHHRHRPRQGLRARRARRARQRCAQHADGGARAQQIAA